MTFQTDVINCIEAFKGHFSDSFALQTIRGLRPEYIAVIEGEKKQILIFDAKRKAIHNIDEEDKKKLNEYKEIALNYSEEINIPKSDIHSYSIKRIFVYDGQDVVEKEGFLFLPFRCLRSYLLELIYYPNIDKVVSDISSLARTGSLTKRQIEVLLSGMKFYTDLIYATLGKIREYTSKFIGFEEITSDEIEQKFPDVTAIIKHKPTNKHLFVITRLSPKDNKNAILNGLKQRIANYLKIANYEVMFVNPLRVLQEKEFLNYAEWREETPLKYIPQYLDSYFRIVCIDDFFCEPPSSFERTDFEHEGQFKEVKLTHKVASAISITYKNKDDSKIEINMKFPLDFEKDIPQDVLKPSKIDKKETFLILSLELVSDPLHYDAYYGRRCELKIGNDTERHVVSFIHGQLVQPIMTSLFVAIKEYLSKKI